MTVMPTLPKRDTLNGAALLTILNPPTGNVVPRAAS